MSEKTYTEVDALLELGVWKRSDLFFIATAVLCLAGGVTSYALGWIDKLQLIASLVACVLVTMVFACMLMYRVLYFLVKVWAEVKKSASDAARMAVAFIQGGTDAK